MLRSHNLVFCGWVVVSISKLDIYIEDSIYLKYNL